MCCGDQITGARGSIRTYLCQEILDVLAGQESSYKGL